MAIWKRFAETNEYAKFDSLSLAMQCAQAQARKNKDNKK